MGETGGFEEALFAFRDDYVYGELPRPKAFRLSSQNVEQVQKKELGSARCAGNKELLHNEEQDIYDDVYEELSRPVASKAFRLSSQKVEQGQKKEKVSAPSAVNKELLLEIFSLQKASGAWELSKKLATLCGSTESDLQAACPSATAENGGKVWATALALVILAGKFGDKKDVWIMIAKKGKKWLKAIDR